MAIYAIGDIQGCYDPLMKMLDLLNFDTASDVLWLVGDLVNRGPNSIGVIRLVMSLGEKAIVVLGNHDISLLALLNNKIKLKNENKLSDITQAHDRDSIIEWLRYRPLLHHDCMLGFTMVHAGILPQWDLKSAQQHAKMVEIVLRSSEYINLLSSIFSDIHYSSYYEHLSFIINVFTRMRFCTSDGKLSLKEKDAPSEKNKGLLPWFEVPNRRNANLRIIFGHWSSLGYYRAPGILAIDSGCVWGKTLTAVRIDIDDLPYWQVPNFVK